MGIIILSTLASFRDGALVCNDERSQSNASHQTVSHTHIPRLGDGALTDVAALTAGGPPLRTLSSSRRQGRRPRRLVQAMLKKRADPSSVNSKGKTPLDLASTSQSPALVKLLERYGAVRQVSKETDRRVNKCFRVSRATSTTQPNARPRWCWSGRFACHLA